MKNDLFMPNCKRVFYLIFSHKIVSILHIPIILYDKTLDFHLASQEAFVSYMNLMY